MTEIVRKTNVDVTGNEVIFTRIIDAPRELVFEAWTDPKHLAQWWGPKGFTNPVCQVDLRPGGAYRIVMRSPEGVDYPMRGVYLEVKAPERLVFTDIMDEHPTEWHEALNKYRQGEGKAAQELVTTVTFEEQHGKTKLTIMSRFASAADRDAFLKMGMSEGWAQSLERLEEHLAKA